MTIIALDDEPLALTIIKKHLDEMPEMKLLASFTDAGKALEFLDNHPVDLMLCDINMPDISGLQLVGALPAERPMVIFLTAYGEYAIEGYDLDVVDFLVKPVSLSRFRKALQKAAALLQLKQLAHTAKNISDDHFYVYSEYVRVKIMVRDILFIESMGDYVKIHLTEQLKPVVTLERLKKLAEQLKSHGIQRIHRSFLVNIDKIEARQKYQVRVAGRWLPLGERYRQEFHPEEK